MSQIINDMQASKTCGKCKSLKSNTDFKVRKNGSVNKTCESCLNPRRKNKTKIENETNGVREDIKEDIREHIKEDFLSTILTTGYNLEELIESKPTARGQILTKFMGLENLKIKEELAKEIYNDWGKKLVSNTYNKVSL